LLARGGLEQYADKMDELGYDDVDFLFMMEDNEVQRIFSEAMDMSPAHITKMMSLLNKGGVQSREHAPKRVMPQSEQTPKRPKASASTSQGEPSSPNSPCNTKQLVMPPGWKKFTDNGRLKGYRRTSSEPFVKSLKEVWRRYAADEAKNATADLADAGSAAPATETPTAAAASAVQGTRAAVVQPPAVEAPVVQESAVEPLAAQPPAAAEMPAAAVPAEVAPIATPPAATLPTQDGASEQDEDVLPKVEPAPAPAMDDDEAEERALARYKALFDRGLITQPVWEAKQRKILGL